MIKAFKAMLDNFTAQLALREAELRTGITLVEATAVNEQLVKLRHFGDPAELLEFAKVAGTLGLKSGDIEPMIRGWHGARYRFWQLEQRAKRYADEFSREQA